MAAYDDSSYSAQSFSVTNFLFEALNIVWQASVRTTVRINQSIQFRLKR